LSVLPPSDNSIAGSNNNSNNNHNHELLCSIFELLSAGASSLVRFDTAALALNIQTFVLNVIANYCGISVVILMTDILQKKYCLQDRFRN
jgi:hypothetical protein